MVIYDDLSGDTLKLDVVTAEIFRRVQQEAATSEQLAQHLSSVLDVEVDLRLERLIEIALERFEVCGLMISTGASTPDVGQA
jgi:PqqD family protein of HPr-rel-A system